MIDIINVKDANGGRAFAVSHSDAVKVSGKSVLTDELMVWRSVVAGTIVNGIIATNYQNTVYNNGVWYTTNANYKGYFLPVIPGQVYKVVANSSYAAMVHVLADNTKVEGTEPNYIEGFNRTSSSRGVAMGNVRIFTIPEGAGYLWVQTLYDKQNRMPTLYLAEKSVKEESAETAVGLAAVSNTVNAHGEDISKVKGELKEVPLRATTVYEPTYCDGHMASKKSGSAGNQKRISNLSAIFAKKGDLVQIICNTSLLGEGEYFTCGFWESSRTTYLPATTNLTVNTGLVQQIKDVTNTQKTFNFTVQNDATTMVHITLAKWNSGGTEQSIQPASNYEAGGLFTVEVLNHDALGYRVPVIEQDLEDEEGTRHEQIVGMLEMLAKRGTTFAAVGMTYTSFSSYGVTGYDADAKTFKVEAKSDTKYGVLVYPVVKGQVIRRTVTSTVSRTIYFGFTQTEVTAENIVDGEGQDGIVFDHAIKASGTVFDVIIVVPYDGWMLYYRYNQNWNSDAKMWNLVRSQLNEDAYNALLDKLGYVLDNTYHWDNVYSDSNWYHGSWAPKASANEVHRSSPTFETLGKYVKFVDDYQFSAGTERTSSSGVKYYEYGGNIYTITYRVYGSNDGKTWVNNNMLNAHTVANRLINVSSYKYFRFTAFLCKKTGTTWGNSGWNNSIGASVRATLIGDPYVLAVTFKYVESSGDDAVVYKGEKLDEIVNRLTAIEEGGSGLNTDIISLNNRTETLFRMRQLNKVLRNGNTVVGSKLNILHFSDIHDGTENLRRILDYYSAYNGYIQCILNTGDSVGQEHNDTSPLESVATDTEGVENILNVIGNHDTSERSGYTPAEHHWTDHVGNDAYDKFIKPWVDSWGVQQPADAEENGYCYYYKDWECARYTSDSRTKIHIVRLVVVDAMALFLASSNSENVPDNDPQMVWLENLLDDSKPTATDSTDTYFHIVLASHYGYISQRVLCAFSSLYNGSSLTAGLGVDSSPFMKPVMELIGNYVAEGGRFVCCLAGHVHKDIFGTYNFVHDNNGVQTTYRLPVLRIDTANATTQAYFSDIARSSADKSYDLFNIFSIDVYRRRFCVMRVGADLDSLLHHIGTMTYSYADLTKEDNMLEDENLVAIKPVVSGKANRAANPTEGHLAGLDGDGNVTDSGCTIVTCTQDEYDALDEPDINTLYIITA